MKLIIMVFLLISPQVFAEEESLMQDAITKPALSLRCKELFNERADKIRVQQKLNALLQRNLDMAKKSPNAKEAFHARLKASEIKINNELHLTNLSIQQMEENIVRSGCPGLSLE
ncbi:MAG: hypothetical protein AB7I27_15875 [Bacteriovoracaceae bacterium]